MTDLELIEQVKGDGAISAAFMGLAGRDKAAYLAGVEQGAGVAAKILRDKGVFRPHRVPVPGATPRREMVSWRA
ncbi:MAG: hypothetical protein GY851_21755 [bacterium]|nr:hypothetical protein [bacterium]